MAIYVYQVILEDGLEGPIFEVEQPISEPALEKHPITGHKVKKIIQAPNISTKNTPGAEKMLSDKAFLEKKGFTKYEKDKLTGKYHKVVGKNGPNVI